MDASRTVLVLRGGNLAPRIARGGIVVLHPRRWIGVSGDNLLLRLGFGAFVTACDMCNDTRQSLCKELIR